MVLLGSRQDLEENMSQIVPSAGFTPPCDYNNFADTFDLSLLPGEELPLSPSTQFYTTQSPPPPKIYTSFYPNSPISSPDNTSESNPLDLDISHHLAPDFQKLLDKKDSLYPIQSNIYLEVPSSKNYHASSPIGALSPYSPLLSPNSVYSEQGSYYPHSPTSSLYSSNTSVYSTSPRRQDYLNNTQYIKQEFIKEEHFSSSNSETEDLFEILENNLLEKTTSVVKQETSTVDFSTLLEYSSCTDSIGFPTGLLTYTDGATDARPPVAARQDHQLLREALSDTSFQKKFNIRPIEFGFLNVEDIKMEECHGKGDDMSCEDQLTSESMEPVLNMAIEQMKRDVDKTCATLGISPDPCKWTSTDVLSWLQWTSREFRIPEPLINEWNITGTSLVCLPEEEFVRRSPEGGGMLYAQLEIWKAAFLEDDFSSMQWLPETNSNASSGDVSDDDEDDSSSQPETIPATPATISTTPSPVILTTCTPINTSTSTTTTPPSTTTTTATAPATPVTRPPGGGGGSHIHLWQFLKELLAAPQQHGACIRWLDRGRGVFKIEDSVKVARLWGKRKNRPAMNYDKLSRSIRQYYKKGIMKKTERSQRLVYQFCHPYCL